MKKQHIWPQKMFRIDIENLLALPGNLGAFWKNNDGFYLGCNDKAAELLKLNSRHAVVGMSDFDLPILSEEALALRAGDKKVMRAKKALRFNYTITQKDSVISFLSFKAPLFDANGKIAGIYGIDNFFINNERKATLEILKNIDICPSVIKNPFKLTKRQSECLYHLVKGKTMKQIAAALNLSPKTIEHYLEIIKRKLNCYSRTELIEKALQLPQIRENL